MAGIKTLVCLVVLWGTALPHQSTLAQQTGSCAPGEAVSHLDANNVDALITNTGNLFRPTWPGYLVPRFSGRSAMFLASLWIGGEVDDDLRIATGSFSWSEYWPGPLDDDGNPPQDCAQYDRLYRIHEADVTAYEATGVPTPDLRDWPTGLGAPTTDATGQLIDLTSLPFEQRASRKINLQAGERPIIEGSQTVWWVMNDRGNEHDVSKVDPIGVEIQGTAFAATTTLDEVNNSTFYRFRIINRNVHALDSAYVAMFLDPDLGMNTDDYIGSDSAAALGFVYNGDNDDEGEYGYGTPPPAVGIQFIRTPLAENDGIDNDWDGTIDEIGEQLGLSYLNDRRIPPTGPNVDPRPPEGPDFYNFMKGMYKDGKSYTLGNRGLDEESEPIRYMYSGDPVTGAFWSELNTDGSGTPNNPSDRKILMSSGPFTLDPGEETELVFSIVWAKGDDHLDSITVLKAAVEDAREAYESGFTSLPSSVPPDRTVTLNAPSNRTSQQPVTPTFLWSYVPGALAYELEVVTPDTAFQVVREEGQVSGIDLSGSAIVSWRVRALNEYGEGPWSETWWFTLIDSPGVDSNNPIVLYDNYPDPFRESTTIEYFVAIESHVRIEVFDLLGRFRRKIQDGVVSAGLHQAIVDPAAWSNGLYFYTLTTPDRRMVGKMLLLR